MLLVSSFFVLFFCIYAPIIIKFQVNKQENWQINIQIQYLFLHKNKKLDKYVLLEKKKEPENNSWEIPLRILLRDVKEIFSYIQGKYFVRHCSINCQAGFSRPDFTAYSYGVIWAVLSLLPPAWQEWLTIDYQPNFQEKMLQITAEGIIYMPLGYLMLIMMHILKLMIKEWVNHENRLRGQLDGCSNGEYPANG